MGGNDVTLVGRTIRHGFPSAATRGRTLASYWTMEKGDLMRKALFVGLSAMMVGAVFAAPASAQGGPTAGGSCGYKAGEYGLNNLSPLDIRNPNRGGMNVGTIHTQVEYSGVQPGTVLTILTTSGSNVTGPDLGATGAIRTLTAQSSSGTLAFSSTQTESGATRYPVTRSWRWRCTPH